MAIVGSRVSNRAVWTTVLAALLALMAALPLVTRAQETDLGSLEGEIETDGSSTVGPITEAAAEEFNAEAENVNITVSISGTGGGFERFCNGETDIQNASRAIEEDEVALCAENGVEYYNLELGSDGITVVVNEANDFATCVSTDQLAEVWAEDGTVGTFADLNPEFPADEIALYGPGPDSGTFDFFNEVILGEERAATTEYTPSEDDNILVEGVAGDENALGYFGYAYFAENEDTVNAVAVDTAGDLSACVEPNPDTIRDGSYPLSRPLFIYVNAERMQDEAVQEFIRFYAANAAELVESIPYVPLPDEDYTALEERVEGIIAGEVEPDSSAGAATPEA